MKMKLLFIALAAIGISQSIYATIYQITNFSKHTIDFSMRRFVQDIGWPLDPTLIKPQETITINLGHDPKEGFISGAIGSISSMLSNDIHIFWYFMPNDKQNRSALYTDPLTQNEVSITYYGNGKCTVDNNNNITELQGRTAYFDTDVTEESGNDLF